MIARPLMIVLMTVLGCTQSFAFESSHMKQFEILECNAESGHCIRASGALGFVSMRSNSLVGSGIELQISSKGHVDERRMCASFRFDFGSQFLSCDNRELPKGQLLTLDAKFQLSPAGHDGKRI